MLGKAKICRAFYTNNSTIEYVDVDHRVTCLAMAKQLLDHKDIAASLQVVVVNGDS